ncbi:MAG: UDP-N-acetylmuramoyl-L-alanine--D-glutamate ligase [Bacillota bacterium]
MTSASPFRVPMPGESCAILGLGISNRELAAYLARRGVRICIYDQKSPEELGPRWDSVSDLVEGASLGSDYLAAFDRDLEGCGFDWVFVTPGMPRDLPQIRRAALAGSEISGELALFMILCPAPMMGVTGSSGKTTTTSLVAEMLRCDGRRVWLGGNIGTPLIDWVDDIDPDHVVVLEMSSFQLETASRVPQVGAVLNISPDHLDVHRSMDHYVRAKARMVRCQEPGDYIALGADCRYTRDLASSAPGDVAFFSVRDTPDTWSGRFPLKAWYEEGRLWVRGPEDTINLCATSDLPLRGMHNVSNTLAAALVALRMGVSVESIRRGIRRFTPVRHRLEEVGEIGGVLFVNDSIATSPDRTAAALHSYDRPVVLILGGYNKGLSFDRLARQLSEMTGRGCIRAVILMGEAAGEIEAALRREADWGHILYRAGDLERAFNAARGIARAGDVVLMSPACASFDAFANYMRRGDCFRSMVQRARAGERADGDGSGH